MSRLMQFNAFSLQMDLYNCFKSHYFLLFCLGIQVVQTLHGFTLNASRE